MRASSRLFFAAVVLLPLACWPGIARPFSVPKLWFVAALDVLVAAQWLTSRQKSTGWPEWPWVAWVAAVSLSALTAPRLAPEAFLLLVLPLPLAAASIDARALCVASLCESAVVLLQFFHQDPFSWAGWRPEGFASPRMRVYGTLGNPDFVAAWLAATLPLCLLVRSRAARAAFAGPQVAALLCTGSRVVLLAVPASMLAWIIVTRRVDRRWVLAVPLLFAVVWLSPARPLRQTAEGRLYLARLAAANLPHVPVTGFGPGAFESLFAGWQRAWVGDHPEDRRWFQGPVDHVHNDYLEFWVEYGPPGAIAFLALCGWLLSRLSRTGSPTPVLAALAALLAIAWVDFPFHRPAEWALFCVLAGCHKEAS